MYMHAIMLHGKRNFLKRFVSLGCISWQQQQQQLLSFNFISNPKTKQANSSVQAKFFCSFFLLSYFSFQMACYMHAVHLKCAESKITLRQRQEPKDVRILFIRQLFQCSFAFVESLTAGQHNVSLSCGQFLKKKNILQ